MRQPGLQIRINISRARPTVVEIDPGDSLPDRGENESGIVATINGLAGFLSNGEAGQQGYPARHGGDTAGGQPLRRGHWQRGNPVVPS